MYKRSNDFIEKLTYLRFSDKSVLTIAEWRDRQPETLFTVTLLTNQVKVHISFICLFIRKNSVMYRQVNGGREQFAHLWNGKIYLRIVYYVASKAKKSEESPLPSQNLIRTTPLTRHIASNKMVLVQYHVVNMELSLLGAMSTLGLFVTYIRNNSE